METTTQQIDLKRAKAIRPVNYKSIGVEHFKADKTSRTVSGYLAGFGNVDMDGDVLVKGCFAKSILERGPGSQTARKIAYLYMHNMTEPIGHFTLLEERDYGLYFEAYIDEIPLGDRVLTQYESGTLNQHSIGFRYVWDKCIFEEVDGKEVFVCYELQLFEGSVVSLGANENTPFTGMKAEQMDNERKKLNAALDEAIKTLEGEAQYKVKQIISRYIALATEEPGKPLTRADEPQEMDYGKLLKSLTN